MIEALFVSPFTTALFTNPFDMSPSLEDGWVDESGNLWVDETGNTWND